MSVQGKRSGAPKVGEVERRTFSVPAGLETRAEGSKGIRGVGIAAGVTVDIGPFTEEIDRGAIDDVLEMDVRGLFNHNDNYVLGRTKSGTMKLRKVEAGIEYDIPELPASRADVMEAIERKDVDGSSFSFTVLEDAWTRGDENTKPHRRVMRFQRVYDMGPVAFPAYEDFAVVSARSLQAAAEAGAEIPPELRDEPEPGAPPAEPPAEELAAPAGEEGGEAPEGAPAEPAPAEPAGEAEGLQRAIADLAEMRKAAEGTAATLASLEARVGRLEKQFEVLRAQQRIDQVVR